MAFVAMVCFLVVLPRTLHLQFRWNISTLQVSIPSCEFSCISAKVISDSNSPIVQMHVSKDSEGNPVPVIGVDDVARGIAFLASDESKMINGALIPIDNAWSTI